MHKKVKYFCIFLMLLTSAFVWSGCKKEEPTNSVKQEKENESFVDNVRMQVKDEGVFYLDGFTTRMMFYDYNLGESMPLCDKPNCKHNSAECNAFIQNGFHSLVASYRGKLYFMEPTSPECILYESDLNGNNRKVLTKLNEKQKHELASLELPAYFRDDKMYLGLQYTDSLEKPIIEKDGTVKNTKETWEIIQVSLSDGNITTVKELEEIDLSNSYIMILDYFGDFVLYSKNKNLYCYHMQSKDEKQIYSKKDKKEYIGLNKDDGLLYYAMDTNKETEIFQVDMQTWEEKSILKQKKNKEYTYWKLWDNKLYFSIYSDEEDPVDGELKMYDLKGKKEYKITKEDYSYIPVQECKNWYILRTKEGVACIKKADYDNKKWDKIQVIGAF